MLSPVFLRQSVLPLILFCLLNSHAFAAAPESSCPASFPTRAPMERTALATEADRLSGLGEACSWRADYFAYQGVVLLTLRQTQQAANALEKALMLDPDLAGAQLDYAQALAELGEVATARSLAQDVARRPDIPLALQAWLAERLRELGQAVWRLEWTAQLSAGSESNLNSAPSIQTLTLTLPGGDVPVALAASERGRSGSAQRMDIAGFASRPVGDGLFLLNAEISARNSPGNDDTNQRTHGANAAYLHPFPAGQIGFRVNGARLSMGGQAAYASSGWSLLYLLPEHIAPAGCRTGLSHDQERRDFPASPILAGNYAGNQAWLNCRKGEWQFNFGLQSGVDRAKDPERLGGDQRRYDLVLGAGHPLAAGVISVAAQRGRLLDREIYSALLGGQPRAVERRSGRVSYEYPLTKHLSVIGSYEKTLQNSNIGLFNIENNGLYFGIKFRNL